MKRSSLVTVFLIALSLRVGLVLALQWDEARFLASAHDEHAQIARNIALGHGFRFNFFGSVDQPVLTSQQAPMVPYVLAFWYQLLGVETTAAIRAMILLQIALGSLACVFWMMGVQRASQNTLGAWTAGTALAIYPPFVFSTIHIQALPWNIFWLTMICLGTTGMRRGFRDGPSHFVIGSIGALLTDPIMIVVVFGMLGWLMYCDRRTTTLHEIPPIDESPNRSLPGTRLAWIAFFIILGIAPWLIRNGLVHHRLVMVKDSFWYVFWQGNTRLSCGTDKLDVTPLDEAEIARTSWNRLLSTSQAVRERAVCINEAALSGADLAELAALPTEIERMDWFGTKIKDELHRNPGQYLEKCLLRLRMWLFFDTTNPKSLLWPYQVCYLVLFLLFLIGVLSHHRHPGLFVYLLGLGLLSAVHILVITSARFRVLAEVLMVPHAGAALVQLVGFHAPSYLPRFRSSNPLPSSKTM